MAFWNWLEINSDQLIVILTLGILLAAIMIGLVQNKINSRSLDIEEHAEIFAYYAAGTTNLLTLQNTGSKSLYIQNYTINGDNHSIPHESLIPPGQIGTFRIVIPLDISNMDFRIFYRDLGGTEYATNITVIITDNKTIDVYTRQQEKL